MSTAQAKPPPCGVYVPAVLFFDDNEDLNVDAIKKHVLRLATGGVTGILVQGSNGEAQHLSREERKEAISITRRALDTNGFTDVLVIAGTGAQSTRETIQLCKDAKEAGAAYALVLTPSVWPPQMTSAAIIRFHKDVADASPIPTMVYNFPTVTAGQNLNSDILIELGQHPNIVGTKLSCGDIGKLQRLTTLFPSSEFATFPGKSDVYLQGLTSGGAGIIGASVNLAPKVHARLFKLFTKPEKGEEGKMQDIQRLLSDADWQLGKLGSIAGIKAVVSKRYGYGNSIVRRPLPSLGANLENVDKIDKLLEIEDSL